jgi:outer membrane protein OmpA-like peptidoglycan-associated protein
VDKQATPAAALELTKKRAEAVVAYLTGPGKVAPARLEAVGAGDTLPVEANMTDAGRAANRRVEFTFVTAPR